MEGCEEKGEKVCMCVRGEGGCLLVSGREEAFVKEGVGMEVGEDAGYEQEKMGEEEVRAYGGNEKELRCESGRKMMASQEGGGDKGRDGGKRLFRMG